MPTNETRAVEAVRARMAELGDWSAAKLIEESGLAEGTVRSFLSGQRWPRDATLAAIERAISWPVGSVVAIAEGADIPAVGRSGHAGHGSVMSGDDGSTFGAHESDTITVALAPGALDGLDPLSIAQVEAEARVAALRFLRELQSSRPRREEETTP